MGKEDLYISVSPKIYRKSKSNILLSQANLLQALKKLHNLKVLASQKRDLKKILHGLMSSAISQINHIQEKMPKAKVPKVIQKDKKLKSETKVTFSKRNEIEEELQQIQAKLQQLNA